MIMKISTTTTTTTTKATTILPNRLAHSIMTTSSSWEEEEEEYPTMRMRIITMHLICSRRNIGNLHFDEIHGGLNNNDKPTIIEDGG